MKKTIYTIKNHETSELYSFSYNVDAAAGIANKLTKSEGVSYETEEKEIEINIKEYKLSREYLINVVNYCIVPYLNDFYYNNDLSEKDLEAARNSLNRFNILRMLYASGRATALQVYTEAFSLLAKYCPNVALNFFKDNKF